MDRCQMRARLANLMREITVIGGGLAGLALAVSLCKRGVPVRVLEAASYPRHRVCGEFISGVSPATLDYLGIRDLFEDARRHRSLCWHIGGRLIHRGTLPSAAMGISRYVLDERLRQRLEEHGGTVETGVRARPVPAEGLVWAAGRRPRPGTWIGLKAHLKSLPMAADLEMHSGSNGYAGLAGVEDGWINVCGLFRIDHSIDAKGPDLLGAYLKAGGNSHLADLLGRAEWRPGSFSTVAGFELGVQPVVPGLFCVGDAESMIPPFTGNGMSMAFQAAETACGPLVSWVSGERSWQGVMDTVRSQLGRRFRKRLAVAGVLHKFLMAGHGRSLLQSLSAAGLLPFKPILSLVR